jgi:hypothetical protein
MSYSFAYTNLMTKHNQKMHILLCLLAFVFFSPITAQESAFKTGQEWQLELGQITVFLQLREEQDGIWLGDGFINESGEEQLVTLAPVTAEEREELELSEAKYWLFSVNISDQSKSDSGVAYKCVFDLSKGDYLDTGEMISVIGERFDYTITIAGPQLRERGNSCTARQPG